MSNFDQLNRKSLNLVRRTMLPGFESGQFEHRPVYDEAEFKASFPEESGRRDNRVSIRISGKDLTELQKLALSEGIPTQAFIGNIIHNYAQGLLVDVTNKPTVSTSPQVQIAELVLGEPGN